MTKETSSLKASLSKSLSSTNTSNWKDDETLALVVTYKNNIDVLEGKFSLNVTSKDRTNAWDEIVQSVNSCSKKGRSLEQVRKRWFDIKSKTKKKERTNRARGKITGGGPPPEKLKIWEQMIVDMLPESVLDGIDEGFDSFKDQRIPSDVKESTLAPTPAPTLESKPKSNVQQPSPRPGSSSTLTPERSQRYIVKKSKKRMNVSENCECTKTLIAIHKRQLEVQEEVLKLKREKLEVSKRRNELLEDILNTRRNSTFFSVDDISVSPIIKLT